MSPCRAATTGTELCQLDGNRLILSAQCLRLSRSFNAVIFSSSAVLFVFFAAYSVICMLAFLFLLLTCCKIVSSGRPMVTTCFVVGCTIRRLIVPHFNLPPLILLLTFFSDMGNACVCEMSMSCSLVDYPARVSTFADHNSAWLH